MKQRKSKSLVKALASAMALTSITTASGELVAYYNFDEGTGTVANDLITDDGAQNYTQNQGTIGWTEDGQIGGALDLNGASSLRGMSPFDDTTTQASFAFWVQIKTGAGSNDGILVHRPGTTGAAAGEPAPPASANQFWGAIFNNGAPSGTDNALQWRTNNNNANLIGNNLLEFGEWKFVVVTVDGEVEGETEGETSVTTQIYVDGALELTQEGGSFDRDGLTTFGATGFWNIGDDPCCGGRENPMLMDELGFYNNALTAQEVADIYQAQLDGIPLLPPEGDQDNDGIPDSAETNTGTFIDANDTGTDPEVVDTDGDGIGDGDEIDPAVGSDIITNPTLADTDGDGLLDGFEIDNQLDAAGNTTGGALGPEGDLDDDGLNNLGEQTAGSDPRNADTDGDTLSDGDEVNTFGSSPILVDTDGDTLDDPTEVNTTMTNPALADSDMDNLPDNYEVDNNLNPNSNAGDDGATGDPDGDNLDNEGEFAAGTNPQVADTDADGVNDGDEVNGTLNTAFGNESTLPLVADTDGDGLSDGEEINGTLNVWLAGTRQTNPPGDPTNPNSNDSDDDELLDGFEIRFELDPNNADDDNGVDGDPDGDELVNGDEQDAGTNPRNSDTDGDGLDDLTEVDDGETSPVLADTDMDGLNDFIEVDGGETDPADPDSDDDGSLDGEEVAANTDPNNPEERGPIAAAHYYSLDDGAGASAFDGVGGVNGAWANVSEEGAANRLNWIADGRIGGASEHLGNGDNGNNYFQLDTLTGLAGAGSVTYSMWIRPTNQDGNYDGLFMTRTETAANNNWGLAYRDNGANANSGRAELRANNGPTTTADDAVTPVAAEAGDDEGWFHLMGVYDGTSGDTALFLNGVEVATGGTASGLTLDGEGYRIGSDPSNQGRDFDGRVDDITIFSRALPEAVALDLYNGGLVGQSAAQVLGFTVEDPPVVVAPTALLISAIGVSGDDIVLTLPAPAAGQAWEVLSTTDLTLPIASFLSEGITTEATFTDTGALTDDDVKFYVIREVAAPAAG